MKLLLQRAGFLGLMVVLGVLSLIGYVLGFPFAWRFTTDQSYWLPLAYALNVLCISGTLALVFWGLRGFLFGRGRPWLAWLSMAAWILVWFALTSDAVSGRIPLAGPPLMVGESALKRRLAELREQPWSPATVAALPPPNRERVCQQALLKESTSALVVREGFPMEVFFPEDMSASGLFESNACPDALVQTHKKLLALEERIAQTLHENVGSVASALAQVQLLGHPDSVLAMSEIYSKHKADAVARKLAISELTLRLYTNGQVKDHVWEVLPESAFEDVDAVHMNPYIWRRSKDAQEDDWRFWTRYEYRDGREMVVMWIGDCKRRTLEVALEIRRGVNGTSKLVGLIQEADTVRSGTLGHELLRRACSGKSKEVRIPDDLAKQQFGR